MTADLLNQVGLALGLISGLLLTPEIIDRIPIQQIENSIESRLEKFEVWLKFPIKLHPPSWKIRYAEGQREVFEPITAIPGLIVSMIWIGTLIAGVTLPSKTFIFLSLLTVATLAVRNLRAFVAKGFSLNVKNFIPYFILAVLVLATLAPVGSLVRVLFWVLRIVVNRVKRLFKTFAGLKSALIWFAIVSFFLSNVLQFIATFLD